MYKEIIVGKHLDNKTTLITLEQDGTFNDFHVLDSAMLPTNNCNLIT